MSTRTIGLAIDHLYGNFQQALFEAVKKWMSLNPEKNLLVYEGKSVKSPWRLENQYNLTYQLIDPCQIDGLIIVTGSVFNWQKANPGFQTLFQHLELPKVSLGCEVDGVPSVTIDNEAGMYQLTSHLVKDHKYKNIAFVGSVEKNQECALRFQGFQRALVENDLVVEERWTLDGDFRPEAGVAALIKLEQFEELEAIVFANDDMAIGALEYISLYRPDLNDRFYVTGFDNQMAGDFLPKPLTSVEQPLEEMVNAAFNLLEAQLNGEVVPEKTKCDSILRIKQSCGCNNTVQPQVLSHRYLHSYVSIAEQIQTMDEQELYNELVSCLPEFCVTSCFVVRYKTPLTYDGFESLVLPESSQLMFAYINGHRKPELELSELPTKTLLPASLLKQKAQWQFELCPLFYKNMHFGFLILDISKIGSRSILEIKNVISQCLMADKLIKERLEAEYALEGALKVQESRNRSLQSLSSRDDVTSLYNRRGLKEQCEKISREDFDTGMVMQIELDNLKYIKDHFGHDASHSAVRGLADILRSVFNVNDVVSRLGGDEFAVVVRSCQWDMAPRIMERLYNTLEEYNERQPMDRNLEISLGYEFFNPIKQDVFKVLEKAAAMLYETRKYNDQEEQLKH